MNQLCTVYLTFMAFRQSIFSFPGEINRVYLQHLEDVDYSDYINACYVDVSADSVLL